MNLLKENLPVLTTGFISALISGYICIDFLLKFPQKRKLYVFAGYCVVFTLLNLVLFLAR